MSAHAPHSAAHGSVQSYVTGFLLSLVLTFASFGVVMLKLVPHNSLLMCIVLFCVLQLVVQLIFFLHIGTSRDQRANTAIFICTALLIAIIVAGSLWVMHNANANMMPTTLSIDRALSRD